MTFTDGNNGKRGRKRPTGNHQNPLRNMVVAYVHGGKPGPNPLDARLFLRKARPSVAKQPKRGVKKQPTWYIEDGEYSRSTSCTEKERETAEDVLTLHKNKRMEDLVGNNLPGALLFDEVLADHCAHKLTEARTRSQLRTAATIKSHCATLPFRRAHHQQLRQPGQLRFQGMVRPGAPETFSDASVGSRRAGARTVRYRNEKSEKVKKVQSVRGKS